MDWTPPLLARLDGLRFVPCADYSACGFPPALADPSIAGLKKFECLLPALRAKHQGRKSTQRDFSAQADWEIEFEQDKTESERFGISEVYEHLSNLATCFSRPEVRENTNARLRLVRFADRSRLVPMAGTQTELAPYFDDVVVREMQMFNPL